MMPETKSRSNLPRKSGRGKTPVEVEVSDEATVVIEQAPMPAPEGRPARRPRRRVRGRGKVQEAMPSQEPAAAWDESQFEVMPQAGATRFHDLRLPTELMHAISETGFRYCTPIQAQILPATLTGSDAAGRAQTGTGKTAAFLITILTRLLASPAPAPDPAAKGKGAATPRALILAPTRELVLQIVEDAMILARYCPFNIVAVLGGVDYAKQQRQLTSQRVDIVAATPGRLLDFSGQGKLRLDAVEVLVIDEADRMLDMGFIPDVRRIVYSLPPKEKRQTMLFSATLTPEVMRLAAQWTRQPVLVEIEPEQVVTETVKQLVYLVTNRNKFALLYNIITRQDLQKVLVFCNRKDETRRLAEDLIRYGLDCAILSGEVRQEKRLTTLEKFRDGRLRVLVATDVAGRGIHIERISHVINYTLPYEPESYVHRIGRTGRAGSSGISVSFADESDSFYLPAIELFIGEKLPCIEPEEEWLKLPPPTGPRPSRRRPRRSGAR